MAAIPVTIKGTILTKAAKDGGQPPTTPPGATPPGATAPPSGNQDCVIVGSLSLTGLSVGGGPVQPPSVSPPDPVEPPDPEKAWEAKTFWTPENGWQVVLVPTDEGKIPTPSGGRK